MQVSIIKSVLNLKLKLIVFYILLYLILFQIVKLNLVFNLAPDYFKDVAQRDIFFSLLNGLYFDLYVMSIFLMPLQLLLLIPIKSKFLVKAHFVLSMLILILLVLFSYGDSVYFSFFYEHMTAERLLQFFSKFFIKSLVSQYLPIALIVTFFLTASLFLGVKIIGRIIQPEKRSPDRNISINFNINNNSLHKGG